MSQRSQPDQFRDDMATKAIVGFRRLSVGIVVSAGVFLVILLWGKTTSAFQDAHNSNSHYYFEDARIFAFNLPDQLAYHGLRVGDQNCRIQPHHLSRARAPNARAIPRVQRE